MNWDDIEDILFDGSNEQIQAIKCPECNGNLKIKYFDTTRSMEIFCKNCYILIRSDGVEKIPNFAKYAAYEMALN